MKALLRRHAWRIAGVTGAGLVLSALAMTMTGIESHRSLTSTAVAATGPSAEPSAPASSSGSSSSSEPGGMDLPTEAPSAAPTSSAASTSSASATPAVSIDATPAAAFGDPNTTMNMVVGAIVLAMLATGLAGFALARQPAVDGDDSSLDIAD